MFEYGRYNEVDKRTNSKRVMPWSIMFVILLLLILIFEDAFNQMPLEKALISIFIIVTLLITFKYTPGSSELSNNKYVPDPWRTWPSPLRTMLFSSLQL